MKVITLHENSVAYLSEDEALRYFAGRMKVVSNIYKHKMRTTVVRSTEAMRQLKTDVGCLRENLPS